MELEHWATLVVEVLEHLQEEVVLPNLEVAVVAQEHQLVLVELEHLEPVVVRVHQVVEEHQAEPVLQHYHPMVHQIQGPLLAITQTLLD